MAARELTRAEQHLLGPKKKGRTGAKVRKIIPDRDDPRGFNVLGAYASFIQQASQASPPHLMHGRTTLTACTRFRSRLQPRTTSFRSPPPHLSTPHPFSHTQSIALITVALSTHRQPGTITSRSGPKRYDASTRMNRSDARSAT